MEFGIFYEHQLPRPWTEDAEERLLRDALDQVELADRLGVGYAWEVEHHFLEEYSHSSAPEVFLAAASQRSKRIRLGHGIVLMPPAYNPPARVAERLATLDLVSGGRVDWGTGESASRAELEGFGIDPNERRAMWRETVEQVANMMVMDPYPGFSGKYFSMPVRNVLPKPVQKPHPPIWVACSNRETIRPGRAARDRRADLRLHRSVRGPALGGRLLRDVQEGVRADRPRRQPQHRDGHRLLLSRRRGGSRAARQRWLSFLPVRAGLSLRLRHAHAGTHEHLEPVSGRARSDRDRGAGRGRRVHRHSRSASRVAAHLPGRRRGSDDLHPARRQEPARPHLRS